MGTHIYGEEMDADAQRIFESIRRIFRVLRESSRAAESRVGLSGAQLFVLQRLSGARALSVNELAERTFTHQSTVSVVAKRLCELGYVVRGASSSDGRRTELALSPKGRALLARAPEAAQERLVDGVRTLPAPRRRRLAEALQELTAAMGIADQPAPMFFEEARPRHHRRRR
jgi:DNA-binding MarR family transcriptional regulator